MLSFVFIELLSFSCLIGFQVPNVYLFTFVIALTSTRVLAILLVMIGKVQIPKTSRLINSNVYFSLLMVGQYTILSTMWKDAPDWVFYSYPVSIALLMAVLNMGKLIELAKKK